MFVFGITFVLCMGNEGDKFETAIEGQENMVSAEDIPGSSAKLMEARTFLVVRSLKRAWMRTGSSGSFAAFREALSQELSYNRIQFRIVATTDNRKGSGQGSEMVVCFDRLIIQFGFQASRQQDNINLMKRNLRDTGARTGLIVRRTDTRLDIEKIQL